MVSCLSPHLEILGVKAWKYQVLVPFSKPIPEEIQIIIFKQSFKISDYRINFVRTKEQSLIVFFAQDCLYTISHRHRLASVVSQTDGFSLWNSSMASGINFASRPSSSTNPAKELKISHPSRYFLPFQICQLPRLQVHYVLLDF